MQAGLHLAQKCAIAVLAKVAAAAAHALTAAQRILQGGFEADYKASKLMAGKVFAVVAVLILLVIASCFVAQAR